MMKNFQVFFLFSFFRYRVYQLVDLPISLYAGNLAPCIALPKAGKCPTTPVDVIMPVVKTLLVGLTRCKRSQGVFCT